MTDIIAHERRVAYYSFLIADKIGLSTEEKRIAILGGFYHDIGKIKIPEIVLMKEKVKEVDRMLIKVHPIIGYALLVQKGGIYAVVAPFVLFHHERWDGKGYPFGLKRKKIPLISRIISVADVYDALTNARPYKREYSKSYAFSFIKKQKNKMFDPLVVDAFLKTKL